MEPISINALNDLRAQNQAPAATPTGGTNSSGAFAALGTNDFLKLLITQLRTQDPLEPVGNEELLRQIASIRDIELSTTISESLRSLTGQERFASASSLIGQFVTSVPHEDGTVQSGIVVGVRIEQGKPMLRLAGGAEIPMERVEAIEPPDRVARALIGRKIVGLDRRDPVQPRVLEGIVTGVRTESLGEVILELDTGESLPFQNVLSFASASAA